MTPILNILAVLAAATSITACQKSEDTAFGAKVREYLLAHPEVIREAVQKLSQNEAEAAAKASVAAIRASREQLERDPRDFVANPGGATTVVEFFDYRCQYCKLAAPEITKLITDHPEIRFVFKEMPIFGEVSDTAAKIALTPMGKAKGFELYKSWMAEKALSDPLLDQDLKAAGIDPAAARALSASSDIAKQIADNRALAKKLGIEGTPAFIVGDTLVPGADMAALKLAIANAQAAKLKVPG